MRLRDEIIGKFIASKDYEGNVTFTGTRYLVPRELDSIYFQQDMTFYIGNNELFTSSIINRPLTKLYNVQESLLRILDAEIIRVPNNNVPVYLN